LVFSDEHVTPVALDLTDAAQIRSAADYVESLDVLITNAGLAQYDDLSDSAALEWHGTNAFIHDGDRVFRT
jgi:NADP-dependent 3-hydroxy acid dehydrogenase YdfG